MASLSAINSDKHRADKTLSSDEPCAEHHEKEFVSLSAINKGLKGLYAISDGAIPYDGIIPILSQAFRGGVQIFQLRDKQLSDEALLPYAREIQALCKDNGVTFIINDRVDLAIAIRG